MGNSGDALCDGITDEAILGYAHSIMKGKVTSPERRDIAHVLEAYVALRERLRHRPAPGKRNCDVMTTATALRKGWERRCEYSAPCCPFEYAVAEFL